MLAEMRPPRRILGVLEHVHAVRDGARCGVVLGFRARRPELPIVAWLDLRGGGQVEAALGLACCGCCARRACPRPALGSASRTRRRDGSRAHSGASRGSR
jgi:hypothetical protein